jgi:uncharacterized protein (DUF1697 family)
MDAFVILIRGINVGGKSKVPMAELRQLLEELGFSNVSTFIASGNVIVRSNKSASEVKTVIEAALPTRFTFESKRASVLVLSLDQLKSVVSNKPEGFGEQPDTYHSDVIFLMGINGHDGFSVFKPKEGVDTVWLGEGVIYSQRLSALRTKSRLNKIMGTPAYQSITIRTWNTTVKLLELLRAASTG